MNFPKYGIGTKQNETNISPIGSLEIVGHDVKHTNYFETGEILRAR